MRPSILRLLEGELQTITSAGRREDHAIDLLQASSHSPSDISCIEPIPLAAGQITSFRNFFLPHHTAVKDVSCSYNQSAGAWLVGFGDALDSEIRAGG